MTRPQATSGKLQATSGKIPQATSGPEARPPAGVGIRPHPKRGWEIRALRQPQPPAKYIRFSRISQELFCRRTLNIFLDFYFKMGYSRIIENSKKRAPMRSPTGPLSLSPARLSAMTQFEKSGRSCESSSGHKGLKPKSVQAPGKASSHKPQASSDEQQGSSLNPFSLRSRIW